MPGCYTSMYRVKKKHALLENELFFTEKILTTAYNKGLLKEYPEEKIHEITEDLLNTEFHDVLPGSSIQCGEDNGLKLLDHGLLEAERLKTRAVFALSSTKEVSKPGEYPIFVFNPHPYELEDTIEEKINKIVQKVYGGVGTEWSTKARNQMRRFEKLGFGDLPVCMAKTQYSLSDNPKLLGRPEGFKVAISELTVSAGAGFIVVLTGDVMKMPGLPKTPSAESIDIDANGKISGLF